MGSRRCTVKEEESLVAWERDVLSLFDKLGQKSAQDELRKVVKTLTDATIQSFVVCFKHKQKSKKTKQHKKAHDWQKHRQ